MTNILILIAIAVYMFFMVYIGVRFSKANGTSDDFYLGGRKLGPFVTAMSAEASDMSSWLLMGLPGLALATGIAEVFWTALGLFVGTYANWLIVAKRIRVYSEKTNSSTLPDFFANRFGDKSGLLVAISAVIIILFFVPYTSSGFAAIGKLFESLFGINYHVAMITGGIIIAVYTIIGGFLAASTTDLMQSIVMTIALIVVVGFSLVTAGGFSTVSDMVADLPGYISLTSTYSAEGANSLGFLPIVSTLAWGLGYFGMPHILLRFMAIQDKNKLKMSRRIASAWVFVSMAIAIFIGVVGYAVVQNGVVTLTDPERIIIEVSKLLAQNNWFTAIVAGLIISGILASIMSTADSQMLAASSSVSENIVKRFFVKNMSTKSSMLFARLTVGAISILAIIFAWNPNSSVFEIVSFAWAGFGAAFGPIVLFALFWKRTNKWGAFAGILTGGASVLIWKFFVSKLGGAFAIYELLPAFILSAIAIVVVSLLTKAPEQSVIDDFNAVKREKNL